MPALEPGFHEIAAADYHDDPCAEPSLSASTAQELLAKSPLHAWYSHPRLNPGFEREEREIFDLGAAAHAYLLEGETGFAIIEADDWRTKAAKEARDLARAQGRLPVLRHKWDAILAMADAINAQLDAFSDPPRPFSAGKAEQTLVWQEGPIWCRARLDWLGDDHRTVDDLKTTGGSANPEDWTRGPMFAGPALQAAFYLRGLSVLSGVGTDRLNFRFVVAENYPPFALSVVSLGPEAWVIAEKQRRMAVEIWSNCMDTGKWPAYPRKTCYATLPPWIETQWVEREMAELA